MNVPTGSDTLSAAATTASAANLRAADPAPADATRRELEAMQQQLLMAQRLSTLGELSASITHEFNNILTTVINYAKMGLRHKDEATRDKAFDRILSAAQRAARLTSGVLAYARHGGRRRQPYPLAGLVEDVLVLVEKDLSKHRIELNTRFEADPQVVVNPGEIQQVVLNLIVNARQAMDPGGRLTVGVRESGAFGELVVADSGRGIPRDVLPRIFEPFFTTKQADASGQGGTGLGLALCRRVIEEHGGRIRVESAVGRGTRFTIKLPIAATDETTAG
ncbi:MAG: sensor histidine kinase [Planctomycetota bacterium]|nr:MAG: sensor histidine kinase [Planctomycetota bacterium]